MNVVVLDESQKKNNQICELLQRKKHKVVACHNASMFLEALEESSIDRICMNVDSWQVGRAIFKYFDINLYIGGFIMLMPMAIFGFKLNQMYVFKVRENK